MNEVIGICPLCGKVSEVSEASYTFLKSGNKYVMPFPICAWCGLTIWQANEAALVRLLNSLHVATMIHELEKEVNNHEG